MKKQSLLMNLLLILVTSMFFISCSVIFLNFSIFTIGLTQYKFSTLEKKFFDRSRTLKMPSEDDLHELDEGEYYFRDLVGCKVQLHGEIVGEVGLSIEKRKIQKHGT